MKAVMRKGDSQTLFAKKEEAVKKNLEVFRKARHTNEWNANTCGQPAGETVGDKSHISMKMVAEMGFIDTDLADVLAGGKLLQPTSHAWHKGSSLVSLERGRGNAESLEVEWNVFWRLTSCQYRIDLCLSR